MSLDQQVGALTAALKSLFWQAWEETAVLAPWNDFTTIVPSTTRIENYINFTPVMGMVEWTGARNFGTTDSFVYSLRNSTFHNGFRAALEDVQDDQTGGLMRKPAQLVVRAKKYPGRAVMKQLNLAASTIAFDGSYFVGSSHNFGSGNNSITFTAADHSNSSSPTQNNTYNLYALYYGDEVLKPLIWQNRAGPDLETNAGTPQSKESRQLRWWCDLRGTTGFSYWWNCCYCQITGLPTVAEMQQIYQALEIQFRTFQLPKYGTSDDGEYVHEQTEFSASNLYMAGSTGLTQVLRQSLNQSWIPQNIQVGGTTINSVATTNTVSGFSKYVVSQFLNTPGQGS